MKKLLTLFLATFLLSGALGVGIAHSDTIFVPGENTFYMKGDSYFEQEAGELWGLFRVQVTDPASWSFGDGDQYLTIRFGGLFETEGFYEGIPGVAQYEAGLAEVWLTTGYDPFADSVAGGPGTYGYNSGADTWGFGDLMATHASSQLVLSAEFDTSGSLNYEFPLLESTTSFIGQTNALETLIQTRAYLNVVGGLWAELFDTSMFYDSDLRLEASNIILDETGNWSFYSESASVVANVVPEPGSALLLGFGLSFVAYVSSRRRSVR